MLETENSVCYQLQVQKECRTVLLVTGNFRKKSNEEQDLKFGKAGGYESD